MSRFSRYPEGSVKQQMDSSCPPVEVWVKNSCQEWPRWRRRALAQSEARFETSR